MNRNFEHQIPEGYTEVFKLDAKEKKTGLIMNGFALLIEAILLLIGISLMFIGGAPEFDINSPGLLIALMIFGLSMVLYIVLHELTHGAAFKLLTHEKLSFGLSWSCAFCGVPNIYVYRRTAIISLTAPLILFTLVLIPITVWLYFVNPIYYILSLIVLGLHLGGCVGDGYLTYLFLFKFRDKNTLMRDTGPMQYIYTKHTEE